MKRYLDKKLNAFWYAKPGLISRLLWPLSVPYQACVFLREQLFKRGLIKIYVPKIPVIVVGNITLGGVGKTPVVSAFAKHLKEQGKVVGIVSRGYGGVSKTWPQVVKPESDPALVGDESVMLARQLGCLVVVSPKRVDAIRVCEAQGCDVIISDDGLTHYYFKRTAECVVVDGSRQLGNGFCLPAGPLREPSSRLRAASFILNNTRDRCDEESFYLAPVCFTNLKNNKVLSLRKFKERKVHAVSAIGNNARFFQTLRDLGCDLIEHSFPDHYPLSDSDLSFNDNCPVIMTEKDAVKCVNTRENENLFYLTVCAEIHPTVYKKLNNVTNLVA